MKIRRLVLTFLIAAAVVSIGSANDSIASGNDLRQVLTTAKVVSLIPVPRCYPCDSNTGR